ncbi:MAG: helix-turn-helix transcriptional regulator [Verrucomicrobia bacterium]|nr:helix-turn-helix transcriptional regulator [Verrucomicrobiota bacterium]
MKLGTFIAKKRKAAGLTQVELAEKAGVGIRFIRDLEQGKESVRMDAVNKVLYLFGVCLGPVPLIWDEES